MKDSVINLSTGVSYYVLEEVIHNDRKFLLGAQCDLDSDNINTEELFLMEAKGTGDNLVVDEIYDDDLAKEVTILLMNKFQN